MKCLATALAVVAAMAAVATADRVKPPTVIVLRLDIGAGVERGLGERIQREVEDQARRSGLEVTAGEANLADTAAVAGCTSKIAATCLDELIATLGFDELVYGSVERSMAGNRVTVARARAGARPLEMVIEVPAANPEVAIRSTHPKLDELFPVIAGGAPAPVAIDAAAMGGGVPEPVVAPPTSVADTGDDVEVGKTVAIAAMTTGGAMLITGVLLWIKAGSLQDDIDNAPDMTAEEVAALRDLEDRAAGYASWGNRLAIGGALIGGVSAAWWLIKGRRHGRPATAAVAPWLSPTGGGLSFTWRTP